MCHFLYVCYLTMTQEIIIIFCIDDHTNFKKKSKIPTYLPPSIIFPDSNISVQLLIALQAY